MELNKINSSMTNWGAEAANLNENFDKVSTAIEQVKNATIKCKGYFSSESALKLAIPTAAKGDKAYVGNNYPYQIWIWNGSSWGDSGSVGGEESVNLGDYHTKEYTDAKLSELGSKVESIDSIPNYESGITLDNFGNTSEKEGVGTSEFIKVESNMYYSFCAGGTDVGYLLVYDNNKTPLEGNYYWTGLEVERVIGSGAGSFIRFSFKEDADNVFLSINGNVIWLPRRKGKVQNLEDKFIELEDDTKDVVKSTSEIESNLYTYENQETPLGTISSYYINNKGVFVNNSSQITFYWKVKSGDKLKIFGSGIGSNYAAWAIYDDIPTSSSIPSSYSEWVEGIDEKVINIEKDCYIAASCYYENERTLAKGTPLYDAVNDLKTKLEVEVEQMEIGVIENYYINKEGTFKNLKGNNTKYWEVKKGDKIRILGGQSTAYAAWAFYTETPTITSTPYKYKSWESESDNYVVSPIDGYVAVGGYKSQETMYLYKYITDLYNVVTGDIKMLKGYYYEKKCLYVGDSISTLNNYQWKGFIEDNYNLAYVRDKEGELAPANGGITIRPAITESESLAQKSIWYRCAENRMSIYDFDIISLFGGTNDMTDENLIIGSVNDVAFVDNVNGFSSDDNVTNVRPDNLSLASALRGCILMLKRDFPNKEIIIPTVMPCGGQYGNWTDISTGLRASEAIAEMQMKMAEKYKLKAIPLYWSMNYPNMDNNRIWVKDGVHPNMQGALNIQRMFAQILCL